MDLDFSEEQQQLRETVRRLCAEYAPIAVVRAMEDDPTGYPAELWKQLGELGLLGLLIPEGLRRLRAVDARRRDRLRGVRPRARADAALRARRSSRRARCSPPAATRRSRSGCRRSPPARRSSRRRGSSPTAASARRACSSQAKAYGDGFVLTGVKRHVAFASAATRLLVLARTGAGARDIDLFLVDPHAPGVTLTPAAEPRVRHAVPVDFADVRVPASDRIGAAGSGWDTWDAVMHDAIILLAAQAMGGAERALEITVEYAKERKQFDKPLGAFQAISHYLADAATAVDGGKTLVYEAAWARATGRRIARLAPMAKLFACQTYRDVTAMCQQVWGGVGFTIEYDIQLYFRRAKQLQLTWWDAPYLEELIAADVLDGDGPVRVASW